MEKQTLSPATLAALLKMQQNEITESEVYRRIAARTKDEHNKSVLNRLADEEAAHYEIWKQYTNMELKPNMRKVRWTTFVAAVLGFTFAVKKMENGESSAEDIYTKLAPEVPEAERIAADEDAHEHALMELMDEERLRYVGSMVLGLNDALVELTGTLAGLTLAMQNTRLVALSGLITGISATLSMASSEFLSARSEGRKDAMRSCVYTGIAYVITVALLVLPYLLFSDENYLWALGVMIVTVVIIIAAFNYYLSVAKTTSFKKSFFEMVLISLGVAAVAFVIGLLVKRFLGVDI